ncbi:MAG: DUF3750 domain-containing protein [Acidimicrobiia bacterium]|nr:DUF3750 domain-containing protein [Acidimicrobiia bacterium]
MRRHAAWLLLLPVLLLGLAHADRDPESIADWRSASRASVGLAPDPARTSEAVVQVYAARAVHWRGYFGVHTWIAAKRTDAAAFVAYEVTGFAVRRGGRAVRISDRAPDGRWFGSRPQLLADLRGAGVDELIDRVDRIAATYPYDDSYRIWPGPNSNTFTAFVLRQVPELRVDLPAHAVGKDYLGGQVLARPPSGTGVQVSLFGALGIILAAEEGVEVNVLGATFGIDPADLALKLPMVGSVGFGAHVTASTLP